MKPIVVNAFGEAVVPFPNRGPHIPTKFSVIKEMQHVCCGGLVTLRLVTDEWKAISCAACFWRELVPASVRTYVDLEQAVPPSYNAEAVPNFEPIGD